MGYLAYGAMAGLGGEYLKQSEEQRVADRQKIRDERLNEFAVEAAAVDRKFRAGESELDRKFRAGESELDRKARATESRLDRESRTETSRLDRESREAQAKADRKAKGPPTQTVAGGSEGWSWNDDKGQWEKFADPDKQFAPTSASIEWDKFKNTSVKMRGSGTMVSMETMMENWRKQAYYDKRDELGQVIQTNVRNPDIEDFPIWLNGQVEDESMIDVLDPKYINADPNKMWEYAQRQPHFNVPGGPERAIESIRKMHDWWNPPGGEAEAETPKPVPAGDQTPQQGPPGMQPQQGWTPQSPNAAVDAKQQGMLSQAQGTMLESSAELKVQIDRLKNQIANSQGRLGDPSRVPALQQLLQQYQLLYERALMEEAQNPRAQAGPASVVANRPKPQATQVAQR